MPELPEVETVRRTLAPRIIGKTISEVTVYYPKMILPETPESFKHQLMGQTIQSIGRRGKYLLFQLNAITLVVHLRMEGKFFIKPIHHQKDPHEHLTIAFSDGTTLCYHDVRKFGTMDLRQTAVLYDCLPLIKLGYEPHEEALTKHYLKNKLKTTRAIKTVLLDQTIILGLGNIYVDEVLFCAKINPNQSGETLTLKQCTILIDCSKRIIEKATALGGSSIRTYLDSLGISGKFQNELQVHLREGEPCPSCSNPIKKIKVSGRGTYYCPQCQKLKHTRHKEVI